MAFGQLYELTKPELTECLDLLRRLLEASPLPQEQASASSTAVGRGDPAAAVSPARAPVPTHTTPEPPAPARVFPLGANKNRLPYPDEPGELTITPVTVEQSGKAMVVTYQVRSGGKVRTTKVRCWDPTLFSDLLASQGQVTTFLTKESKGYTNIVGVKR